MSRNLNAPYSVFRIDPCNASILALRSLFPLFAYLLTLSSGLIWWWMDHSFSLIFWPWGKVLLWSWAAATQRFDWDGPRVCSSRRCACRGRARQCHRTGPHSPYWGSGPQSPLTCSDSRASSPSSWSRGTRSRTRAAGPSPCLLRLRALKALNFPPKVWSCPTQKHKIFSQC